MDEKKGFYTTKELAAEVKVSQRYIRQLIETGKLKAVKVGRTYVIMAFEVKRFLRERGL